MHKTNMTKEMKWLALIIAVIEYAVNTGIISTDVYSAVTAVSILFVYLLFCEKRSAFSVNELLILLFSFSFVLLNRDLSNFSLGLMWMLFFILSKSTVDYEQILKSYFISASVCFLIITFFYFAFHFNKSADMLMWRGNSFINRLSLGFIQPNFAMMSFLGIMLASLYLSHKTRKAVVFIGIVAIPIFYVTQSRTSGYILFVLLVICFLFAKKIRHTLSKFERFLVMGLSPVLLVASYSLVKVPINAAMDVLLSGRITLYQSIYNEFGIHLIGNSAAKDTMLDTGYLQSLIAKGILFTLFLFISFLVIFFNQKEKQTRLQALIIATYFLIAFTETSFFRFIILFPVLIIVTSPNNFCEKSIIDKGNQIDSE